MTRYQDNASSLGGLPIREPSTVVAFSSARRPTAFTLTELLVVIGIISLLLTILVPSLRQARELAAQTNCQAGLHRCGTALANYVYDYRRYPNQRQGTMNTTQAPMGGPYILSVLGMVLDVPLAEEVGWEWDEVIRSGIDPGYVADADVPCNEIVNQTLSCPGMTDPNLTLLPFRNTYWPNGTTYCGYYGRERSDKYNWDLGYYYYGGMEKWKRADPACSPRKLTDPADWALMGDQINNTGGDWNAGHMAGKEPRGGNIVFHDQHIEWYPWADGDNFRLNNKWGVSRSYYWRRTVSLP